MSNPSKQKGTAFESAVRRHMRLRLADDRIDRRALHGSKDLGDLYGIFCHGFEGIAECKCYRSYSEGDVALWRAQTLAERGNADADFGLLVVKEFRRPTGLSTVHVTLRDLACLCREIDRSEAEWLDGRWVRMTLDECCDLMTS